MKPDALIRTFKQLERDVSNFSKTGSVRRTANYLAGRLQEVEKITQTAAKQFEAFVSELGDGDSKMEEQAEVVHDQIRELYFSYRSDLLDAMDKAQQLATENIKQLNSSVAESNTGKQSGLRLPKINLPVFSGSYESWRAFRDLFVSLIHSNESLSEVQKMHYLKSSIAGEADKLLVHLGLDKGNYDKAWKILIDRYDHTRYLVTSQLKCFFNQPVVSQERAEAIKQLQDTSTEVIHSLENLNVDSWDVILIYVLLQKLPIKTQQLWEERLGMKADSKELPTLQEFKQFLENRFRTLEAVVQQPARGFTETPRPSSHRNSFHQQTKADKFACKVCSKGQHAIRKCSKFLKMSISERCQRVEGLGICKNCLSYSHSSGECPSTRRCYYCQQPHHSLLHFNANPQAPSFVPGQSFVPSQRSTVNTFHSTSQANTQVLLATAMVNVRTASGEFISLRALLDSGSEATFITESAVQLLRLKSRSTHIEVSGLGLVSSGTCTKVVEVTLSSQHAAFATTTQACVFKSLSGLLPARTPSVGRKYLDGLVLADPNFFCPAKIDLLIGGDVYAEILLPEMIRSEEENFPVLQKTKLGWILFGRVPIESQPIRAFFQTGEGADQLKKFWELEEIPVISSATAEDAECEEHFVRNVRKMDDGRYQVSLPFKGNTRPVLGRSQEGALQRFLSLEKRLASNTLLRDQYVTCMEEYKALGHMSVIEENELSNPGHYFLPHHAVLKESSSTTKLRVVFDASFRTADGLSLNDQLMTGPKLQVNVIDIILRWRTYRFTFTADLEKMYRQIWVSEQDSRYQLIFWRKTSKELLNVYRLKTVTFGTASAPYLAIRTLKKLADDTENQYPLAARMIRDEMYVDDLISGADTLEEANKKMQEIRAALEPSGFNLRKWTSNSKFLLKDVREEDREVSFSLPSENGDKVKTLGIHWLPGSDEFSFSCAPPVMSQPTKRFVLSTIARLFDPLGWITPCILIAKSIMQQLWVRKTSWDQQIDTEMQADWNQFYEELKVINEVRLPRWVSTIGSSNRVELHGFCDASEKAYGAAIYLRVEDEERKVHTNLLIAKSKVAPVASVSLPRLELCGAVMLAKLIHHTTTVLERPEWKTYAWTDSTITLAWINGSPSKWETFVRNRVAEIQRLVESSNWRHVPTQENPADLASRGMLPSALIKSTLWWNGPQFLQEEWNFQMPAQPNDLAIEECRKAKTIHFAAITPNLINELIQRSSDYNRLVRVISYCRRFACNSRDQRSKRAFGSLRPSELESTAKLVIRSAQEEMFPGGIPKSRGMVPLNPFQDSAGILRVGGRLQNSDLAYDQQHPIILEPSHHLTNLIIRDAHQRTLHGGTQQMVSYLRTKFWILGTKRAVKRFVHQCVICFRFRHKKAQQLMGELPASRVQRSRPFSHTGIDYAGPISVRSWKGRGAKCYKAYLAIFVCLATKAIHLEAVSDLTTQAFLAAFRRFTARRGICSKVFSDCGTNFVGAEVELRRLMKEAAHDWKEIADVLATHGTQWKFIPPASPHFGGLWEAGVKSVKHHFRRIVGNGTLTYEELATLLSQIEACLNSRPLCPLSEDPDDFQALTPGHFLIGEAINTIPEPDRTMGKQGGVDRWKTVQLHLQGFWHQWQKEYLARLQQRPKWLKPQQQLKVDDLVLLRDERLPPAKWSLGRIQKTYPGTDRLVRVVKVKTQQGEFKRPITKLCPLPVSNSETEN